MDAGGRATPGAVAEDEGCIDPLTPTPLPEGEGDTVAGCSLSCARLFSVLELSSMNYGALH